jgi:hypothetical protein
MPSKHAVGCQWAGWGNNGRYEMGIYVGRSAPPESESESSRHRPDGATKPCAHATHPPVPSATVGPVQPAQAASHPDACHWADDAPNRLVAVHVTVSSPDCGTSTGPVYGNTEPLSSSMLPSAEPELQAQAKVVLHCPTAPAMTRFKESLPPADQYSSPPSTGPTVRLVGGAGQHTAPCMLPEDLVSPLQESDVGEVGALPTSTRPDPARQDVSVELLYPHPLPMPPSSGSFRAIV